MFAPRWKFLSNVKADVWNAVKFLFRAVKGKRLNSMKSLATEREINEIASNCVIAGKQCWMRFMVSHDKCC